MAERINYDHSQLEAYFDRIALPVSDRQYSIDNLSSDAQLDFFFTLTKQQLLAVPFENLTLHYSWNRVVDVYADHLYDKIVGEKRGGYCMENNSFFNTVLLSLGYQVYLVAARVFNPDTERFGGITHCLNVVTIDGRSYAVDVGFGGRTPTIPMELIHDKVFERSDTGKMRLRYDTISQYLSKQKIWIYEYQSHHGGEWTPQWCFMDFEVLPEDISVMNMAPSRSPTSFFTFKVVCVQFTSEKEDYLTVDMRDVKKTGGNIDGALIIDGNSFKYRKGGDTKWERTFKSEDERLEALRKYFGVEFTVKNQRAIRGTAGAVA
ncbi:arylamine n-acetyltransferase 3 [Fusarium heterosporum]|uniref:Arylamine n-acetyltransferase 3 n=1 Tax=Fusarium heterosporum TaxID=42747 RepID=A0A8H5TZZ5_FUSHE|nr:arylamine n-acetyltransferase 3 [Fusarium heterosporum]